MLMITLFYTEKPIRVESIKFLSGKTNLLIDRTILVDATKKFNLNSIENNLVRKLSVGKFLFGKI